ncbi:MAG TPA: PAC2 family protein [Candidatus Bathyarchaeia archaeon]|nr:PAC2 family protein [Candidatus Bathyarchaeia archaeon]
MLADTKIHELSTPQLNQPILVQGLPGLGYVGKVAADFFIEKLKPKKIAELYSSYLLFPDGNLGINISEDGTYSLPKYEFYSYNERQPNVLFLTGDAQPSVTGQYEVASIVLDYVERFGCRNIFTMGGYGTRSGNDVGAVYAVVGDQGLGERLKKLGAKIAKGGAVTGAAGVILGIGRQRGMECAGLLGATTGVYPDLEAARAVIHMLTGLVNIPVELKDLDTEIEDMRKKMERFRRTELEEVKEGEQKTEEGKDRYIT